MAVLLTLVAALSPLVVVAVLGGEPGRVAAALVLTGVLFVLTLLAGASTLALLPYAAAAATLELLLAGVLIRRAFATGVCVMQRGAGRTDRQRWRGLLLTMAGIVVLIASLVLVAVHD